MYRTPTKNLQSPSGEGDSQKSPPRTITLTSKVRRSIGEREAAGADTPTSPLTSRTAQAGPAKTISKNTPPQNSSVTKTAPINNSPKTKYVNKTAEARACLSKAKQHLANSRNLKTDIKNGVTEAVDRLYQLVKESEAELKKVEGGKKDNRTKPSGEVEAGSKSKTVQDGFLYRASPWSVTQEDIGKLNVEIENLRKEIAGAKCRQAPLDKILNEIKALRENVEPKNCAESETPDVQQLLQHIKDQKRIASDTHSEIMGLKETVNKISANMETGTYADILAGRRSTKEHPTTKSVHSVIISSTNQNDTSSAVIEKIRTAVDAKSSGIRVERLRKAKDQKVIIGCHSKAELHRVTERIRTADNKLEVEEVKNKHPLVIIKDILSVHNDEDIYEALKNQNKHLLGDVRREDMEMHIRYRRKTRNPHLAHVILQVSPAVWQRLTAAGRVHIDLQRLRVSDQSPLIQCSRCLAFGHGRKLCKEAVDLCSHCGGPHLKSECVSWLAGEEPKCRNCVLAKSDKHNHNTFDESCPIRGKWDAIARSSIAYC